MSDNDSNGTLLLKTSDMVDAVDEDGNDLGYQVPKHWGADELDPGVKKKSGRRSQGQPTGSKQTEPKKDGEPAANASHEDWVAFAKKQGAEDPDLVDGDDKPLTRDALRDKYGTPAS